MEISIKNDDTKFNPFCCFFSYLAKRIKIHIFAEKIKKNFRMTENFSCIFCDLVKENDPIKIPEKGTDYSIIKGKFIRTARVSSHLNDRSVDPWPSDRPAQYRQKNEKIEASDRTRSKRYAH